MNDDNEQHEDEFNPYADGGIDPNGNYEDERPQLLEAGMYRFQNKGVDPVYRSKTPNPNDPSAFSVKLIHTILSDDGHEYSLHDYFSVGFKDSYTRKMGMEKASKFLLAIGYTDKIKSHGDWHNVQGKGGFILVQPGKLRDGTAINTIKAYVQEGERQEHKLLNNLNEDIPF